MKKWLKTWKLKNKAKKAGKQRTFTEALINSTKTEAGEQVIIKDSLKNICDLPDELLLMIICHVNPVDGSLHNLRLVCRHFRKLVDQSGPPFAKHSSIRIGPEEYLSSQLLMKIMDESARTIEKVDLSGCDDVDDDVIHHVVKTCQSIRVLNIKGCGQVTNIGLRAVSEHLGLLESLDVSHCPYITPSGIFLVVTTVGGNIKRLRMDNCLGMRTNGVVSFSLGRYCPKLTHLSLAWSSDYGLQSPPMKLNLAKFSAKCRRLEYLDIGYNRCQNDDLIEMNCNCPKLKHLKAHHGFQDLHQPVSGQGFFQLSILDLTDCWRLTDRGLILFIDCYPMLKVLILTRCYDLRGRGIVQTISSCQHLSRLVMEFCFYMDEKALELVGSMSTNLSYMDVSHNVNITNNTVNNIERTRASNGRIPVVLETGCCPGLTRRRSRFQFDDINPALLSKM